jgi:hypothetical protein
MEKKGKQHMPDEKWIPQKPAIEILCAIQGSLGTENQRVFARASRNLGSEWAKSIPRADSVDDLMEKIVAHLKDNLQLAREVSLQRDGGCHVIKISGCYLCHGNLVKERHGISAACGISMFPVGALTANLDIRNVRLREIRKTGPVGECELVYEIAS